MHQKFEEGLRKGLHGMHEVGYVVLSRRPELEGYISEKTGPNCPQVSSKCLQVSTIYDLGARIYDLGARTHDLGAIIDDLGARCHDLGAVI